jgi:hypothetical protein
MTSGHKIEFPLESLTECWFRGGWGRTGLRTPERLSAPIAPAGFSDAGALWQDLGSFQVRSGSLAVQLSDAGNGNVIADAVRLQWVAPLPQGPAVLPNDANVPVSDGKGSVSLGKTFTGISLTKRLDILPASILNSGPTRREPGTERRPPGTTWCSVSATVAAWSAVPSWATRSGRSC